ncbi:MAG: autotransporter-associated beta strand repeat-containing protein, partial [Holosporales bacterium]|nr:autotransporter-associated beta strand repeat-containing protein [Holosporales bacterium]
MHNSRFSQRKKLSVFALTSVQTKLLIACGYFVFSCGTAIGTTELSADTEDCDLSKTIILNNKTLTVTHGEFAKSLVGPGTFKIKAGTTNFVFVGTGSHLTALTVDGAISVQKNAIIGTKELNVATSSLVGVGNSRGSVVIISCGSVNVNGATNFCIGGNEGAGTISAADNFTSSGTNNIYIGTGKDSTDSGSGMLHAKNATLGGTATSVYLGGNKAGSQGFFVTGEGLTINSGSSISIGYESGAGSINVGTTLTCDGTITCNNVDVDGFIVHGLNGENSNAKIILRNGTAMVLDGGGSYAGKFEGVGTITKNGAAGLILSGNSTFTGTFNYNGGTLTLQNNLGSATINVASGRTLTLDCSGTVGYTSSISDAGSLQKNGAGTATLSGTLSYTGATTVSGGTLVATKALSTSSVTINTSSTAIMEAQSTLGTGTITITTGTLKLNNASGTTPQYVNTITGVGALQKTGAGTATLSGTLSYSGTTTVSAGKLILSSVLSGNGAITIASGATLEAQNTLGTSSITDNGGLILNAAASYGNNVSGTGSLTTSSSGTTTLSGVLSYAGATTVSGGKLILSSALSGNGGITIASGAELQAENTLG